MSLSRRDFLAGAAAAPLALAAQPGTADGPARIAITLDLEMSRNFPRREDTHWDYEKGNLDDATKRYTVEACRRARAHGGVVHCFVVGRVLEHESVAWLEEIVRDGHPLGNHTYDHVNVAAKRSEEIQFRFRRAPWLLRGREPAEVIRDNIAMTSEALETRLGIAARGFRTPGGFPDGLRGRRDLQEMLVGLGFRWVSSLYPAHAVGEQGERPSEEVLADIVAKQAAAQPFAYDSGLVEVPMSPVSDITAFRGGRWGLDDFLEALRRAVAWAIDRRAVFDFLGHPSCLGVVDPDCRAVELICRLVRDAGERASLVDLDEIAATASSGR